MTRMVKIVDHLSLTMVIPESTVQALPKGGSIPTPPQAVITALLPLHTRSMPRYPSTGRRGFQTGLAQGGRALSSKRNPG